MALSSECQLTQVIHALPVELIDDIINEASRALDAPSISSIALTSHAFRIHANRARFSSFILHRKDGHDIRHTSRSISSLADIIQKGYSVPSLPGICAFATSFSLQMIGYADEVMPALGDAGLAYIFDNLFRSPSLSMLSSKRSLFLYIYRWSRNEDDYYDDDEINPRYNGLSWHSMNLTLLTALENLLRLSELNELILYEMQRLPRDFLRGSNIKHLKLGRTTISHHASHYRHNNTTDDEPIKFESLNIDSFVSLKDIGSITYPGSDIPESPGNILPCLVNLSAYIPYPAVLEEMNKILDHCPALRCLTVELAIDHDYERRANKHAICISYGHLTQLTCISLTFRGNTPLSLIPLLLKHDIPSGIESISFNLVYWAWDKQDTHNSSVIRHLESMDVSILDKLLICPSFDSINHIHIVVMIKLSKRYRTSSDLPQWCSYLKSQVPLLQEKVPNLEVRAMYKD